MSEPNIKSHTVAELITKLQAMPQEAQVFIIDADTMWTIPKFDIYQDGDGVWVRPCDYHEMTR